MGKKITQEVFDALREGDRAVFEEVFVTNYYQVKTVIRKTIRSEADAEEITQDVFVTLWENCANVKSAETFYAYLYMLVRSAVCKYISKKNSQRNYVDNELHVGEFTTEFESVYDARDLKMLEKVVVSQMPHQRRMVYQMSRHEGLSSDEISERLGISKKTVANHLSEALSQLRKVLMTFLLIFFCW